MSAALALLFVVGLVPITATAAPAPETILVAIPAEADADHPLLQSDAARVQANKGEQWVSVEVPVQGTPAATVRSLSRELGVQVWEDHVLRLQAPEDEPLFPVEWHHHNVGQSGGVADADIDTPTAWPRALGAGVIVAVIDSGVDATHPDLAQRMHPTAWDFVDNDADASPAGTSGNEAHGTRVAGVVAASVNGVGAVGVAPEARIMAIRACEDGGCLTSDIANGIHFAIDNGADVINLSVGAIVTSGGAVESAVARARSRNVTIVAAAGNEGVNLDQLPPGQVMVPGGLPHSNVVAVAATTRRDQLAGFSNYGPNIVDIAAPGSAIATTDPGGDHVLGEGTSFSAPVVAGVAALLLSQDPGIGHQELIARIKAFADRPGNLTSNVEAGRVNAGSTLTRRFVDTAGSVFVKAIDHLASINVTQGCDPPQNIHYCPAGLVTRGQMAVFLTRAFNLPQTSTDFFEDDEGAFFEDAANRMAAAGLSTGCAPNRYCGTRPIPRGQMAAMLFRGLDLAPGPDVFVDDEASAFEGAINRVAAAGISFGCNPPQNNRFCPGDSVTRGQMAGFIRRSLDLINS
ncbi:MAG TPA: S8 family serine peptidase [Acidimicrobiia bacterium]|nr:S8 family serine peptidase [Acidimicrobiia bacterium]